MKLRETAPKSAEKLAASSGMAVEVEPMASLSFSEHLLCAAPTSSFSYILCLRDTIPYEVGIIIMFISGKLMDLELARS